MEINNFGVEVIDYACVGDENNYTNHIFTVRVWVDQNMFAVNRSYADFCEFDAQLRRKYPRTNIQPLPLSGANAYARRATVKQPAGGNAPESKSAALDLRASMIGGLGDETPKGKMKPSVRRADKAEVIAQKKSPLNGYLNYLLTLPEVLLSDNLLYFLDEESPDGQILATQSKEVSEVDILLADEVPIAKTVLRQLKIPMNLDPGSVIVWSFSTKHYDIGFSMTFNDAVILPYQRYNSFTEAVSGSIQITDQGKLMLIWDNKYSKMRSKQLAFVIKVFSKEEYEAAKNVANEAAKEKSLRVQQRALVKRALAQTSKTITSVNNQNGRVAPLLLTSSGGNTVSGGENSSLMGAQLGPEDDGVLSELGRLRDEKRSLQRALSEAEAALVEERHASAGYLDRIEDLIAQRDAAEKELAFLRGNNDDYAYNYSRKDSNTTDKMRSSFGSESETLSLHASTVDGEGNDVASLSGDTRERIDKDKCSTAASTLFPLSTPNSSAVSTPTALKSTTAEQLIIAEADSEADAKRELQLLQLQEQVAGLSETVESLKNKLSLVKEDQVTAETQVGKLKAEKKALKEYALKLKGENEQQQATIKELTAEVESLKASLDSFNLNAINDAIRKSEEILAGGGINTSTNSAVIASEREILQTIPAVEVPVPTTPTNTEAATPSPLSSVSGNGLVAPNPMKAAATSLWSSTATLSTQFTSFLGGTSTGKSSSSPGVTTNAGINTAALATTPTPTIAPASQAPVVTVVSGVIPPTAISTTLPTPVVPNNTPASASVASTTTPDTQSSSQQQQQQQQPSTSTSTSTVSPVKKSKLAAAANRNKSRASVAQQTLFVDDLGF